MKKLIFILLIFLSFFYLMTGIVYKEGGFTNNLVIKPYPMLTLQFGGGEEGVWIRNNPHKKKPWFMTKNYIVLINDDWEGGYPIWPSIYLLISIILFLYWIIFILFMSIKFTIKLYKYIRLKG